MTAPDAMADAPLVALSIPVNRVILEVLVALTFWHVARWVWARGTFAFISLIAMALFGWAIEAAFLLGPADPIEDMTYGGFVAVLPPGVPLWICLGWGVLMLSAMQTSDLARAPWGVRPVLDGLLVANISLALDPVASLLSWYTFENPGPYYGVPLDHSLLYFTLGATGSLSLRLGERFLYRRYVVPRVKRAWVRVLAEIGIILLACALCFGLTTGLDLGQRWLYGPLGQGGTWTLFFAVAALVAALFVRRYRTDIPPQRALLRVPIVFHGYFIVVYLFVEGWGAGLASTDAAVPPQPELALVLPFLALGGLVLYGWPYLGAFVRYVGDRHTREAAARQRALDAIASLRKPTATSKAAPPATLPEPEAHPNA